MVRLSTAGSSAEIINDRDNLITQAKAAATVASVHAAAVDRDARFPTEALEEIRQRRLLGIMVPKALGGEGASFSDIVEICYTLGQACGSTAMIYAMHQVKMACIVKHTKGSATLEQIVRRIAADQLLLASSTTEGQAGGNVRASEAAVEQDGTHIKLERKATCISYGLQADGIVTTARRSANALPSDQVLIVLLKSDYTLEPVVGWDTLGMRGTCSPGFMLRSSGPVEQILPGSFADSSAQSMVPYSHILWASLWHGIAAGAVARAASQVRAEARKKPGIVPSSATQLAKVGAQLQSVRHNWQAVAAEFDALGPSERDKQALLGIGWALKLNNLKVGVSESVVQIVHQALQIAGILGYKNDSPVSIGRHYRDVLSAALMISNERIASKSASMLLVFKDDQSVV